MSERVPNPFDEEKQEPLAERPFVIPDRFYKLTIDVIIDSDGQKRPMEVAISDKWDTIQHWPRVNAWMLKIYTDTEQGPQLMMLAIAEEDALRVAEEADMVPQIRDYMFESEHELWIRSQAGRLTDDMFDFGDIDTNPELPEEGNEGQYL